MNGRKIGLVMLVVLMFAMNMNISAAKISGLPTWDKDKPVVIDNGSGQISFVVGQCFAVRAVYSGGYRDSVLAWHSLINDVEANVITFRNSHEKSITACVNDNAKPGDVVTIRGVTTIVNDPYSGRTQGEAQIYIVSKTAPPEIKLIINNGEDVKSFTSFPVDWWTNSRAFGEGNKVYQCTLNLINEQGVQVVAPKTGKLSSSGKPRVISFKPANAGLYTISGACEDLHGASVRIEDVVPVGISDSTSNIPALIVAKTLICYDGECSVDFSKTNTFGKSMSVEWFEEGKENLAERCGQIKCDLKNFTHSARVHIKAWYSWYDAANNRWRESNKKAEVIVDVTVISETMQQPTTSTQGTAMPAVQATAMPEITSTSPVFYPLKPGETIPAPENDRSKYRQKSTPGFEFFSAVIISIMVAVSRKRFKKNK